jgi:protein-S-isoprenylcysteine O-methyltransferase Ste14
VRNPIVSWMIVTAAGRTLRVPNAASVLGLLALGVGLERQVRLVEEPYLRRTDGEAFGAWARRTGRFVPGLGRHSAHPDPRRP